MKRRGRKTYRGWFCDLCFGVIEEHADPVGVAAPRGHVTSFLSTAPHYIFSASFRGFPFLSFGKIQRVERRVSLAKAARHALLALGTIVLEGER